MHRVGEALYLAGGPRGVLLRRTGQSLEPVTRLEGEQLFALDQHGDKLLLGISGTPSRLAVLEGETLTTIATLKKVRYIWDLSVIGETIFAATGTEGQVLAIEPGEANVKDASDADNASENAGEGEAQNAASKPAATQNGDGENANGKAGAGSDASVEVVLDTKQSNVLCLESDGQGRLYAGTDTEGLVYRLTETDAGYRPYVLYDAPEPEIGALLVTDGGTVYAGTADAEQAKPGRLEEAASKDKGRPVEKQQPETDVPQVPPEAEPVEAGDGKGQPESGAGDSPTGAEGGQSAGGDNSAGEAPAADQTAADKGSSPESASGGEPKQAADTASDGEGQGEQKADNGEDARPTEEQLDQLRAEVKKRIEQASESGDMQIGGGGGPQRQRGPRGSSGRSRTQAVQQRGSDGEGNAVYRIDSQGYVDELFRESVMVLEMARVDGKLLVATGNQGQVFRIDPATKEITTLADLEAEQIPAVAKQSSGRMLLATANPARLLRLDNTVAKRGTYVSPIMDASQVSLWGALNLTAELPADSSLTVETRAGNVASPEQGAWSKWSKAQAFMPDKDASPLKPRSMEVQSPPARFLQYRLTFTGKKQNSPSVTRVQLAYVTPNLSPNIASLTAEYPGSSRGGNNNGEPPAPKTKLNLEWEASDPNGDSLLYKVEYRRAGTSQWLTAKKGISDTRFGWQTRHVPDGRYVLRVTADDRTDNPGDMARTATRQSSPVVVDNTAPRIVKLANEIEDNTAKITFTARDATSAIQAAAYSLDGESPYQPIRAEDWIFDSTREPCAVTIPDLASGPHMVTLRVLDERGNATYRSVSINISQ